MPDAPAEYAEYCAKQLSTVLEDVAGEVDQLGAVEVVRSRAVKGPEGTREPVWIVLPSSPPFFRVRSSFISALRQVRAKEAMFTPEELVTADFAYDDDDDSFDALVNDLDAHSVWVVASRAGVLEYHTAIQGSPGFQPAEGNTRPVLHFDGQAGSADLVTRPLPSSSRRFSPVAPLITIKRFLHGEQGSGWQACWKVLVWDKDMVAYLYEPFWLVTSIGVYDPAAAVQETPPGGRQPERLFATSRHRRGSSRS